MGCMPFLDLNYLGNVALILYLKLPVQGLHVFRQHELFRGCGALFSYLKQPVHGLHAFLRPELFRGYVKVFT